jgi:hypothetical protein
MRTAGRKICSRFGLKRTLVIGASVLGIMVFLPRCATDPNAGMVAAREAGMRKYLEFSRNGERDSAALIPFEGQWWFYHPSSGSTSTTIPSTHDPPRWVGYYLDGVSGRPKWKSVKSYPEEAELRNGCLPRALAGVRESGGHVEKSPGHAWAVTSERHLGSGNRD